MITALALMLAASAAPPVYLECDIVQQGKSVPWKLTLNEQKGSVDYVQPNGTYRRPAVFTANDVRFIGFVLDRSDLTITRNGTDILGKPKMDRGQCRLVEPKQRAF